MLDQEAVDKKLVRYASYFHELDAWTRYWDLYHPETRGRYYFGIGAERGLLDDIVPRSQPTAIFTAWTRRALGRSRGDEFEVACRAPALASAVVELDELVREMVARHFGDLRRPGSRLEYLDAIFHFATDTLPPAPERAALVPDGDPRQRTAGRHAIDTDSMWFVWALQLEAAQVVDPDPTKQLVRALLIAGTAMGCSADFAWRGQRRTRPEYNNTEKTRLLLMSRALEWSSDIDAAATEVHHLYRIRERGHSGP